MKILITGGAGYIGSALALALAKEKHVDNIIVYDRLVRPDYGLFLRQTTNNKIDFIHANILDNHSLARSMKGCDIVYHLAAKVVSPDSDNDSQHFEQVNNWGTAAVVNEAIKAQISHFVYLSSVYVYGQDAEIKTTDDTPLPNSFYGISKLRGEEHLMALPNQIKQHIIRSGSVYGHSPATRFDVLINKFLFQAHFFNKIAIHGEGNQIRPFIHIDKVVDCLKQIPNSDLPVGVYNLVEHNASVNDIIEALHNVYPNLEYNHVNRHIKMKDIIVQPSSKLMDHTPWEEKSFDKELREISSRFW